MVLLRVAGAGVVVVVAIVVAAVVRGRQRSVVAEVVEVQFLYFVRTTSRRIVDKMRGFLLGSSALLAPSATKPWWWKPLAKNQQEGRSNSLSALPMIASTRTTGRILLLTQIMVQKPCPFRDGRMLCSTIVQTGNSPCMEHRED